MVFEVFMPGIISQSAHARKFLHCFLRIKTGKENSAGEIFIRQFGFPPAPCLRSPFLSPAAAQKSSAQRLSRKRYNEAMNVSRTKKPVKNSPAKKFTADETFAHLIRGVKKFNRGEQQEVSVFGGLEDSTERAEEFARKTEDA